MTEYHKSRTINKSGTSTNHCPGTSNVIEELTPRHISARVAMPLLLSALGLPFNSVTHWFPCPLCNSQRRDSFRYDLGGVWRCMECGRHGDKYTLIRAMKSCGFRRALLMMCGLARVPVPPPPMRKKR